MKWRQRIADWITGGELTFHQQTAVNALAEAHREHELRRRLSEKYDRQSARFTHLWGQATDAQRDIHLQYWSDK